MRKKKYIYLRGSLWKTSQYISIDLLIVFVKKFKHEICSLNLIIIESIFVAIDLFLMCAYIIFTLQYNPHFYFNKINKN